MINGSNGEALVEQALLDVMGPSLDRRLFDSNPAVADLRPAGLLFGKTAVTPSSDMISDLATLGAAVAPYAGNSSIVYIASSRQAVAITLGVPGGFPYALLASTALPDKTVIAVAAAAVVSALGTTPVLDRTKSASMDASDDLSGSMPTVVTFQTDTVGVRSRWPISWALRDPNAIAFMSAVTW
jgi:hypothetical protein